MLTRMVLAAAALAMTTPAMADCLGDRDGAQCDVFLEQYRADDIPVGTTMVWPERPFLVEDFDLPGVGTGGETFLREDVFYWDGETAHIVPEQSGPPVKIAEW